MRQARMATQTTKKKGETATTVSVGIRIDPKIKFALDMMGRQQKRSLTAVIEWAISNAIAQQTSSFDETFAELVNRVWSTDESTRFVRQAIYMPDTLTYDELRMWETIKASIEFWGDNPENYGPYSDGWVDYKLLREEWDDLIKHVQLNRNSSTIIPYIADVPF
jgi:hypothetical protein